MKILLKLIIGFLALIGALTIALVAYVFVANPFGIRDLVIPPPATQPATADSTTPSHPLLSPTQVNTLKSLGVDVTSLPTTISPEMEACFTNTLGEERVSQIKAGASPTPMDLLKAKSCLN